jgi:hypothetical protein
MMLTRDEILKKLQENKDTIKSFGVKTIGIFGSWVKGKAENKSDIDVVVEFEKGTATFKNVCMVIDFLEELFGKKIDLLTPDGIESIRIKHIKEEIKKEVEYA